MTTKTWQRLVFGGLLSIAALGTGAGDVFALESDREVNESIREDVVEESWEGQPNEAERESRETGEEGYESSDCNGYSTCY